MRVNVPLDRRGLRIPPDKEDEQEARVVDDQLQVEGGGVSM